VRSDPRWVALSVSDPAEDELVARGLSPVHLDLALIELARHLLATGNNLAYGGDLRPRGFSDQLLNLARSYHLRPTSALLASPDPDAEKRLRHYLAAPLYDVTDVAVLAAARNVADVRRVESTTAIPAAVLGDEPVEHALALSEMRRVLTKETEARVLLGGKLLGAVGRGPGVLEEAWCSVDCGRPLFVLGGFGGIGALIGDRLAGRDTGDREAMIASDPKYAQMVARLDGVLAEDLPRDGSAMLAEVTAGGVDGLRNGLSSEDNERLFETDDVDEAISILLHGLEVLG
jgi:SLOG-like protein